MTRDASTNYKRIFAFFIDIISIKLLVAIVSLVLVGIDISKDLLYIVFFTIYYISMMYYFEGKTAGKALLGIQVKNVSGKGLSLQSLILRLLIIFPAVLFFTDINSIVLYIPFTVHDFMIKVLTFIPVFYYLYFAISDEMIQDRLLKTVAIDNRNLNLRTERYED